MKWVTRTHVGNVRKSNQDTVVLGQHVYGVADGMGGHLAGDIASRMAADLLTEMLQDREPSPDALKQCVQDMNLRVYERQLDDPALSGMGTTLTVIWDSPDCLYLAHVGDSRAYLLRNGDFRQVTDDHSLVGEMIRSGLLTPEEAAVHPYRHMITRAVGTDPDVEPDILTLDKAASDRWLICSDGLSGCVSDGTLRDLLTLPDMAEAADRMLEQALGNGGQDNITLVILEVESDRAGS